MEKINKIFISIVLIVFWISSIYIGISYNNTQRDIEIDSISLIKYEEGRKQLMSDINISRVPNCNYLNLSNSEWHSEMLYLNIYCLESFKFRPLAYDYSA